jgi:hypothetical protein
VKRLLAFGLAAAAVAALVVLAPAASAQTTPPLDVDVSGADGHGRIEAPGLACDDGGEGAYWHYAYSASLPAGPGHGFSKLPGTLRLNLDLHSDEVRYPNTDARPVPANPNAFLLGDETTVGLANDRGTLRLRMASGGGCGDEGSTVDFDGVTASTAGTGNTWEVDAGTGAYEGAAGDGTFGLTASVAPGADNPFHLTLDGDISVLQPTLDVEVVSTFWGNLGLDYVSRKVSVTYRITNTGPGFAYDATLANTVPETPGVTAIGPVPQPLGDLMPDESELVTVRYFVHPSLSPPPCTLLLLGCQFQARVDVNWLDALDVLRTPNESLGVKAPLLPPPL